MYLSLALSLCAAPLPPRDLPPALYLVENISTSGFIDKRSILRVMLNGEGELVKETILVMGQRFFGHFGHHRIEQGRFVVTAFGGVVDLRTRKIVNDEQGGNLLGVEDGRVVYRIENTRRDSGLFCFDLKTFTVTKLGQGTHWELPGVKSADNTMGVREKGIDGTIRLYRLAKSPIDLAKGFYVTQSMLASLKAEVPCLWMDADRILIAQSNQRLVAVTTQGAVEQVVEVREARKDTISFPRLWTDVAGRTIYSCGNEFLIDVQAKTATLLGRYALGHGFEASVARDRMQRHVVYHEGNVVGRWVFSPLQARTAPGLVAFAYVQPDARANLGYPDGVACWSSRVGDWRTVKAAVNDLLDWAK